MAKHLAQKHQLTHFDLDTIAWLPTEPPSRAPLDSCRQQLEAFTHANKDWVIEGCYADLLALLAGHANEMVFLNIPVQQCVDNAKARPWEPHKYPSKAAQDENLEMLIAWISEYPHRDDELSFAAHQKLFDMFDGHKHMLTENQPFE
jgi:adenylate kinase family enzyme